MERDTSRLFEEFDNAPRDSDASSPALDVIIRPAKVSDADAIGRISADREGRDPEETIPAVDRALRDGSVGRSRALLVAEVDGSIVGFGKVQYREGKTPMSEGGLPEGWYLTGIVVDPRFRRRGIGTRLTAARMRWIAERGSAAYYFANASNRVSIALHEGFGFAEIARAPAFGSESFVGGEGVLFRAELGGSERRAP
jgi:ribosomal protein S18 acetylase RimI-like enzyme